MKPKDVPEELAFLKRENTALLDLVSRLEHTIAELRHQLSEAVDGNSELKQQISVLQEKLDRILFQLEKKNKKDFGKKTERHNPRQSENTGDGFQSKETIQTN